MHKVFISYHHRKDQWYKECLAEIGQRYAIFMNRSVDTGEIPDDWSDEQIRRTIRDRYLQDSTVSILLAGSETRRRKHVDWEIYSSMYNGSVNKRSGLVVINLPGTSDHCHAPHGEEEKRLLYPDIASWTRIEERAEYERRYPCMPDRIIDNLMSPDVKISATQWDRIGTLEALEFLIEAAYQNRADCACDLRRPTRRASS